MNPFWPCELVNHKSYCSVILVDFYLFDDYFQNKEVGGYTIDKLAKKLAKEIGIMKQINFDSEAGMFCAFGDDKDTLLLLCQQLRKIAGSEKEHAITIKYKSNITAKEADELLLQGFVKSLDESAQKKFLKLVPIPALSKKQERYLETLRTGDAPSRIQSARKINSEARTKTRSRNHYLSHPATMTILQETADNEENPKVYEEIIAAICFICMRHLPDLRTQPLFLTAIKSRLATTRLFALWGLECLYDFPWDPILKLVNDRSAKIRKAVAEIILINDCFPQWMFDPEIKRKAMFPENCFSALLPLLKDQNIDVREAMLESVQQKKMLEAIPILEKIIKKERKKNVVKEIELVLGKLKKE